MDLIAISITFTDECDSEIHFQGPNRWFAQFFCTLDYDQWDFGVYWLKFLCLSENVCYIYSFYFGYGFSSY
jgi:hypothetical protein